MFKASVYKTRRAALLKGLEARGVKKGLVVLVGNGESPMNYRDNAYPFRQDSSFLYFFGPSKPGLAASIDLASGEAFLYGDDPSIDDIVWTGPETSVAELAEAAGTQGSQARSGLAAAVRGAAARGAAPLLFFPPYRDETRVELGSLLGVSPQAVDAAASIPLVRAAVELREIKDPGEIAELEAAVATSVAMHQAALALARPGMRESDIASRVTEVALAEGGYLSFPAIATTRGATLHNHAYGNTLEEGGLFLLDAGAEAPSGYAGDLTSTFPIGRRYDERQRAVYEIVLSMGRAATALLRPGLPFLAAHEAAARAMVEGFKSLGLMRGDTEAAVACGAYALFFVHGLGHQIGLDVHDMENYGEQWVGYDGAERSSLFGLKSLRLAKPLRAGMVHSVEPGVYFIPALIEEWRKEKKFSDFIAYDRLGPFLDFGGIRNEEDWLITENGARRLGPDFDKSVAAMEGRRA